MNLPQICSVLVIFSLVILLGFGSVGIAEAAKAPGVYHTETNSKLVCGDRLCDTPMSVEEKIAEFMGLDESEEFVPSRGILTIAGDIMVEFAGGLSGDLLGRLGSFAFASIFPGADDDGYSVALADMQASLEEHIDAQFATQTNILLGSMLDMQLTLVESMQQQQVEGNLANARSAITTWLDAHDTYMLYLNEEPIIPHTDDEFYTKLQDEWSTNGLVNDVISKLTDPVVLSQDLRVQGFPLYWMGQLMYIAYNQESALHYTAVADPNQSFHATKIKGIVALMEGHLDNTVVDAKDLREAQITAVDCVETVQDITLTDIPLKKDSKSDGNLSSNLRYDSYTFKDVSSDYCWFQDDYQIDPLADDPLIIADGWTSNEKGLKAKCHPDGTTPSGWFVVRDYEKCDSNAYIVKPYTPTSEHVYPETTQQLTDRLNEERDALVSKYNDEIDVLFEPYYDAMDDLCKLYTMPVPESSEPVICEIDLSELSDEEYLELFKEAILAAGGYDTVPSPLK